MLLADAGLLQSELQFLAARTRPIQLRLKPLPIVVGDGAAHTNAVLDGCYFVANSSQSYEDSSQRVRAFVHRSVSKSRLRLIVLRRERKLCDDPDRAVGVFGSVPDGSAVLTTIVVDERVTAAGFEEPRTAGSTGGTHVDHGTFRTEGERLRDRREISKQR